MRTLTTTEWEWEAGVWKLTRRGAGRGGNLSVVRGQGHPGGCARGFSSEGMPYRVIVTLEALGLLLALLAFGPVEELKGTKTVIQGPAFTDIRENGCVSTN